jgi:uncharacterized protein (TIGR01777 family)
MKILIAGGTGFIGQALVADRKHKHDEVKIITRYGQQTDYINWSDLTINNIKSADVIINLAGANIGEKKWSAERKKIILSSRVETTKKLAGLCAQLGSSAPMLLNASAIGIYGLQETLKNNLPPALDEKTALKPATDFLSEVAQAWEQATAMAKQAGVRVVNMRFSVVLDKSGGVLKQLRLPYLFGMGGKVASGEQAFSWIALSDLINAIDFVITHRELSGAINFVAPQSVKQKEFAKQFAYALNRPSFMITPAWLLKLFFGQMADELLINGQHVVPTALINAGFEFQYPTLNDFFA